MISEARKPSLRVPPGAGTLLLLALLSVLLGCASEGTAPRNVYTDVPPEIDTESRYLFFLHGAIVEGGGRRPESERFGVYEYDRLLEAFAGRGFTVISEARGPDTRVSEYAEKVAGQVKKLLGAGVPAENITVAGASKGGAIAVIVSSTLREDGVNYVLIASCAERMIDVMTDMGRFLTGDVLSIYEASDEMTSSCERFFELSGGKGLGRHREVVVNTGLHHGFHYEPREEWVEPVVRWAMGDRGEEAGE